MSMIQEFSSPTRPSFLPFAWMTESKSGRRGMNTAVTTRPTRRSPGLITRQPLSNSLWKPASCRTSHASSAVTDFSRCRMASGTLGLPSGKRSPCHSDVKATRCSFENRPNCAAAKTTLKKIKTVSRIVKRDRLFIRVSRHLYWRGSTWARARKYHSRAAATTAHLPLFIRREGLRHDGAGIEPCALVSCLLDFRPQRSRFSGSGEYFHRGTLDCRDLSLQRCSTGMDLQCVPCRLRSFSDRSGPARGSLRTAPSAGGGSGVVGRFHGVDCGITRGNRECFVVVHRNPVPLGRRRSGRVPRLQSVRGSVDSQPGTGGCERLDLCRRGSRRGTHASPHYVHHGPRGLEIIFLGVLASRRDRRNYLVLRSAG